MVGGVCGTCGGQYLRRGRCDTPNCPFPCGPGHHSHPDHHGRRRSGRYRSWPDDGHRPLPTVPPSYQGISQSAEHPAPQPQSQMAMSAYSGEHGESVSITAAAVGAQRQPMAVGAYVSNRCITCEDAISEVLFIPCRHQVICRRCLGLFMWTDMNCIMCRESIAIVRLGNAERRIIRDA